MLLGLLPFLSFLLCAILVHSFLRGRAKDADVRISLLMACILSSIWIVAGTELLSLFRALRFWPILLWWSAPAVVSAILLRKVRRELAGCLPAFRRPDLSEWICIILIGTLLVCSLLSAFFSAPSTFDAMHYHLPRQIYWIQNHSVSHYGFQEYHQIVMPPFAEYIGMHLMLLSGGDRWANLVQWFSLVMVALAVSLIARDLGAGRKGQLLAAFLTISAPPIYVSASNVKNDIVLSIWVCLLAWWAIRIYIDRDCRPARAILIGATLGLAALTKGTGYIFAFTSCLIMAVGIVRSMRLRSWRPAIIIIIVAALIPLGHWMRNWQTYGSPLGSARSWIGNSTLAFPGLVSNVMRNLTLHMGTPGETLNAGLQELVTNAHAWLDIDPNDPRTTYVGLRYGVVYRPGGEEYTPAGAHLALVAIMLIMAAPLRRQLNAQQYFRYLLIPCGGFVLFCWLLKWQPWHSRLHVPLICLFMPPLAVMLTETSMRFVRPVLVAGILLALYPSFVVNYRPLFGERRVFKTERTIQMFFSAPSDLEGSVAAAKLTAEINPSAIAFCFEGMQVEYPLQRLILDRMAKPPMFSRFSADPDGRWNLAGETPEVIIATPRHEPTLRDEYTGNTYDLIAYKDPYAVYTRRDLSKELGLRGPRPSSTR